MWIEFGYVTFHVRIKRVWICSRNTEIDDVGVQDFLRPLIAFINNAAHFAIDRIRGVFRHILGLGYGMPEEDFLFVFVVG